jgi:hypothetical protein
MPDYFKPRVLGMLINIMQKPTSFERPVNSSAPLRPLTRPSNTWQVDLSADLDEVGLHTGVGIQNILQIEALVLRYLGQGVARLDGVCATALGLGQGPARASRGLLVCSTPLAFARALLSALVTALGSRSRSTVCLRSWGGGCITCVHCKQ